MTNVIRAMRGILAAALLAALSAATVPVLLAQTAAASGGVSVPDAAQFVGPPRGTPLTGDALTRRTQQTAALLRCPVCQGLAIADSPSEMAINMRGQVRELYSRGYTEEQILSYFERSYGQFVLLKPKFQGVNSLVWTLPLFVLIAGVAIVFLKLRKLEAAPPPSPPVPEAAPADEYLARVRKLVKGDTP
jgi:cytochrome c-type biogenesis protein CcmH